MLFPGMHSDSGREGASVNRVRFNLAIPGMGHLSREFTEEELEARYPWVDSYAQFYLRVTQYLEAWRQEVSEANFEFLERS